MFDCAKVELLQVYFRHTLNILHLKTDIIQRSILINRDTAFRLYVKKYACAQALQIKFNYNIYISKSQTMCQ